MNCFALSSAALFASLALLGSSSSRSIAGELYLNGMPVQSSGSTTTIINGNSNSVNNTRITNTTTQVMQQMRSDLYLDQRYFQASPH